MLEDDRFEQFVIGMSAIDVITWLLEDFSFHKDSSSVLLGTSSQSVALICLKILNALDTKFQLEIGTFDSEIPGFIVTGDVQSIVTELERDKDGGNDASKERKAKIIANETLSVEDVEEVLMSYTQNTSDDDEGQHFFLSNPYEVLYLKTLMENAGLAVIASSSGELDGLIDFRLSIAKSQAKKLSGLKSNSTIALMIMADANALTGQKSNTNEDAYEEILPNDEFEIAALENIFKYLTELNHVLNVEITEPEQIEYLFEQNGITSEIERAFGDSFASQIYVNVAFRMPMDSTTVVSAYFTEGLDGRVVLLRLAEDIDGYTVLRDFSVTDYGRALHLIMSGQVPSMPFCCFM